MFEVRRPAVILQDHHRRNVVDPRNCPARRTSWCPPRRPRRCCRPRSPGRSPPERSWSDARARASRPRSPTSGRFDVARVSDPPGELVDDPLSGRSSIHSHRLTCYLKSLKGSKGEWDSGVCIFFTAESYRVTRTIYPVLVPSRPILTCCHGIKRARRGISARSNHPCCTAPKALRQGVFIGQKRRRDVLCRDQGLSITPALK